MATKNSPLTNNSNIVDTPFILIKWLIDHKEQFPWASLIGATLFNDEGQQVVISGLELRKWPAGPLIEIKFLNQKSTRVMLYNLQGLEARFNHLIPVNDQARSIHTFIEDTEEAAASELLATKNRRKQAILEEHLALKLLAKAEAEKRENLRSLKIAQELAAQKNLDALNNLKKFDLLLFDLDGTLVETKHLESFRGVNNSKNNDSTYLNNLRVEARKSKVLIDELTILNIQKSFKSIKLGVITKSPRNYARIILKECFPAVKWDALVAYEDVPTGKVKPAPDGIIAAAAYLHIEDRERIAFIGNEERDILAAYRSGIFAILFEGGWSPNWRNKDSPERQPNWRALGLIPDAVINSHRQILSLITEPWSALPALESWESIWSKDLTHTSQSQLSNRVEKRRHFFRAEEVNRENDDGIWVTAMGRYFKVDGFNDPGNRGISHNLSNIILEAKVKLDYPEWVAACCAHQIKAILIKYISSGKKIIVCPVPSRPDTGNRLERLVKKISAYFVQEQGVSFNNQILKFKNGIQSNKGLNRIDRIKNIRDNLYVNEPIKALDNSIFILDDVTTTGTTFYFADRYLKESGALEVQCLSLTHAIP